MRDVKADTAREATLPVATDAETDERRVGWLSGSAAERVIDAVGVGGVVLAVAVAAQAGATPDRPPWVGLALHTIAMLASAAAIILLRRRGRARRAVANRESGDTAPPAGPQTAVASRLERLQVDTRSGRRTIRVTDVQWFEAKGNYARVHLAGESYLYRLPLSRLEERLAGGEFLRVHRSAIVNLDAIRHIDTLPSGDAELLLSAGGRVRLSRRYAARFHAATGAPDRVP